VVIVAVHSCIDSEGRAREPIHLPNFAADLIRGDEPACWSQLEGEIECGTSLYDLYAQVLIPVMQVLGTWYDSGKIDTAQEHVASHTVQRLVTRASNLFPRASSNGKTAVLACADGDWHDLGIRMLNELLLHAGWSTTYVGASTPSDCLMNTVTQKTVDLVVLSSTVESSLPEALRCAGDLVRHRKYADPTMKVVVGGRAAWSQGTKFYELGVDDVVETLQGALCCLGGELAQEKVPAQRRRERN
jgi:methanogenic corrinoid protein MtbC1